MMIIACTTCNKKFEVNSDLIPEIGRLLECSSCNNQFFFKKNQLIDKSSKGINQIKEPTENKNLNINKSKTINANIKDINKNSNYSEIKIKKTKKKSNILSLIIVFIISFIALIILLDTFEYLVSFVIPNVETILYNLYETIKDVTSFIKDLF